MNTDPTVLLNPAAMILLVEDSDVGQSVEKILLGTGYRYHRVFDMQQAIAFVGTRMVADALIIATCSRHSREVETIRELVDCYLPVIVINDCIDDGLLDDYRNIQIDGYLSKPINSRLILATLNSAISMRRLCQHETHQRRKLSEFKQQYQNEQEIAAKIHNNVLHSNYFHTEVVKAVMSPTALFNGNLLLVERTPDNHLYLLLGDFSGHGLSASIGAMSAVDIFYSMARKGFALADIVEEINAKLHKILPTNIFLAATAVALYPDSKTLSLITCGLPEHFLVNRADGSYQSVIAKNLPLGIVDSPDLVVQNYSVSSHHQLYLLNDAVFESENINREAFGSQRILNTLSQQSVSGIDWLQEKIAEHTQGMAQNDDLAYVELICDVDNAPWQYSAAEQKTKHVQAMTWKNVMVFDIDALRLINPVPVMVNALMEIQGLQQHRQSIFLIVSELFANALDHGVLKLDSALKKTPEGFVQFYQLKEERLQGLCDGWIRLLFDHLPTEYGGRLTIKVIDSGDGFDWHMRRESLENNLGFSGRGVELLESICTQLTFHGKGNRATAVFEWRNEI